jgi:putative selenate reductase
MHASDPFTACSIERLLGWILAEEKQGQIFGIRKELFYSPRPDDGFFLKRYGKMLETPIGVAAGPHTQLAQNIIAAYLTGARYLELKTIQTQDELTVTKPCIDMQDEGYNCEWSQELKLHHAFEQYLNAWIIVHILKDKFGWGGQNFPGFIFNMSVGYDLAGIQRANVQAFLDKMACCAAEKAAKIEAVAKMYARVRDLTIPDCISDNVTISTMHGCPPDEVEKIGRYFIEVRKLHTTIKLNPTLLGPEHLRSILNDRLGFDVHVPDEAFAHDLKYEAGVDLIRALQPAAVSNGVEFNLKLTNTLETVNSGRMLPKNESMVYMSGRALHPISINLARRLQNDFDGRLDISFAAGVDCFNIAEILACNLKPVTVCSDVLKPGGYGRLRQYLKMLETALAKAGADSIDAYIRACGRKSDTIGSGLNYLNTYARAVVERARYKKAHFPYENIKTFRDLSVFDCIQPPCVVTCPVNQNIPAYMYHTARGEYDTALAVILKDNPFPNVQGKVCDHLCQFKCTRINYDGPLLIREIKRFVAQYGRASYPPTPNKPNGLRVAVIGAGPSGLACAYFLALDGFSVTIFEAKDKAGGMAADKIPAFRLDDASLQKDIGNIQALGVTIHLGISIDAARFEALQNAYDYIYIGVGAQKSLKLGIPGEEALGVTDQLSFLSAVRRGQAPDLGKRVAVVGGGNAAMDAARTAKRLVGSEGRVQILYRRTRHEMPAAAEEVQATVDEGIELVELTAPECFLVEDGRVKSNRCFQMTLGEKDDSGRARPVKIIGSEVEIQVDSLIAAIGQQVCLDFLPEKKLEIDVQTCETRLSNVFAGGDAVRGAATLIQAIGDGKRAAAAIRQRSDPKSRTPISKTHRRADVAALKVRQAERMPEEHFPADASNRPMGFELATETLTEAAAQKEAARCLQCDVLCNICTTVCPNRANVGYPVAPITYVVQTARRTPTGVRVENGAAERIDQPYQIFNLGDFCNQCGNCTTFCPTNGAPFQIKPKFFLSRTRFEQESCGYHLCRNVLQARRNGAHETLSHARGVLEYETCDISAVLNSTSLALEDIVFKTAAVQQVELRHAQQMAIMLLALNNFYLFNNS